MPTRSRMRPMVAGERITVKSKVADVQERAGAGGPMDVIVLEDEGRDEKGELIGKLGKMGLLPLEGATLCASSAGFRATWRCAWSLSCASTMAPLSHGYRGRQTAGFGSSPAVYGSLVIVSTDNKAGGVVAALDRASGEIVASQVPLEEVR